jgi:hypothetical protein
MLMLTLRSGTYQTYHILRWFQAYLRQQGYVTLTAPSVAAAQLVRMEEEGSGDAIVGAMSCFLFGAERTILSFDWENKTFLWVMKKDVLNKLNLNSTQFVDLCLLSGLTVLAPAPLSEIEESTTPIQPARALMSRAMNDGLVVCEQLKDKPYLALFEKARAAVTHITTLKQGGEVVLASPESSPQDIHEVLGQRLPDEFYYYLSRGVIGPKMLQWRTRNEIFEISPLDGGASTAYQTLVSKTLVPLRTRAMALLSRSLHRYYQRTDVGLVCWYDEANRKALDLAEVVQSIQQDPSDRWQVKDEVFSQVSELNQVSTLHLQFRG